MNLQKQLKILVEKANKKIKIDPILQKILKPYWRRRLILNVMGQADYIFNLSNYGITLQAKNNVLPQPLDMYIEMKSSILEKIISQQGIKLEDLPFINCKNIEIREIRLAIKISHIIYT